MNNLKEHPCDLCQETDILQAINRGYYRSCDTCAFNIKKINEEKGKSMSEWIDARIKPKGFLCAVVTNAKCFSRCWMAHYESQMDVWIASDIGYQTPLDITHYLPLPETPKMYNHEEKNEEAAE
jgi:hypothetical protein